MIHRVRTTLSFIAVFYKLHPSSAMFVCLSRQVSVKLSDRCSLGTNKKWPPTVSDDEQQSYIRCFGVNAVPSRCWVSP